MIKINQFVQSVPIQTVLNRRKNLIVLDIDGEKILQNQRQTFTIGYLYSLYLSQRVDAV